MTNRIKGFTITLEKDIREDDIQPILDAIQMIKGVASVTSKVSDSVDHMARERVKSELRDKFYNFIQKEL